MNDLEIHGQGGHGWEVWYSQSQLIARANKPCASARRIIDNQALGTDRLFGLFTRGERVEHSESVGVDTEVGGIGWNDVGKGRHVGLRLNATVIPSQIQDCVVVTPDKSLILTGCSAVGQQPVPVFEAGGQGSCWFGLDTWLVCRWR